MTRRMQIAGHPFHVMTVVVPIGLYTAAFVADALYVLVHDAFWYRMAFWCIALGLLGNLGAVLTGLPDFFAIKKDAPPAWNAATTHLVIGLGLVLLYVINCALQKGSDRKACPERRLRLCAFGALHVPFVPYSQDSVASVKEIPDGYKVVCGRPALFDHRATASGAVLTARVGDVGQDHHRPVHRPVTRVRVRRDGHGGGGPEGDYRAERDSVERPDDHRERGQAPGEAPRRWWRRWC